MSFPAALRALPTFSKRLAVPFFLGCYLLLYAIWQLVGFGPSSEQAFISNIFFWPVDLAVAAACLQAASRAAQTPRLARAWKFFAAAVAGQLIGDVIYTLYELHGVAPYPSLADAFYLAFYPLVFAGLLSIPQAPFAAARRRVALDLAIVTLGGSAALVYLVLGPTALADNGSAFASAVSAAYPVGDIVAIGGLALVLLRGPAESARWPLRLVSTALALFIVADTAYSYQNLRSDYTDGNWVDALWFVALPLFAIGASLQRSTCAGEDDPEPVALPARISWLPYGAVALGFGVLLYSDRHASFFPGLVMALVALALAGLVSLRQWLGQRELLGAQRQLAGAQEQMYEAQKLESVGRLAGGIAHDFNNLLTAISGYAELGAGKVADGPGSAELAGIANVAEKAAGLTGQLLSFSRRQVLDPQTFDLAVAVEELTGMLRRMIPATVELQLAFPDEPLGVRADRGKIEQVLVNLAVNARDALPDAGGTIRFEGAAADGQVQLAVSDNGSGMDEETLAHIFEPFFSTKGSQGTGLGLATVQGIIAQSGGRISASSRPGEGSWFTISLPRVELRPEALSAAARQAAPGSDEPDGQQLLLVDDDEAVLTVTAEMLTECGYQIHTAADGEQALAIASAAPESIDLLVTDLVMPGLNGRQTAAALRASQPHMRVLYISGYTDDTVLRAGGYEPGIAFLQKPFSSGQLAEALQALAASSGLAEHAALG